MDELFLVYINHLGSNWREHNIYEFLFSEKMNDEIQGDDWDVYPASNGNVTPPRSQFVNSIGILETDLDLIVIRDSDTFSVWDCVDGIIPLGYENIIEYEEYPEKRLIFGYGIKLSDVNERLYSRDIILNIKKNE